MSDANIIPRQPKLIGIAADQGGFELKQILTARLGKFVALEKIITARA